jgi:hypothetical protein
MLCPNCLVHSEHERMVQLHKCSFMLQDLSWNIYSSSAGLKVLVLMVPKELLFCSEMHFIESCPEPTKFGLYHHVSQVAS